MLATGAKGLYTLQGVKANLFGSRRALRLPSERPELARGFLALPRLAASDPAETLLWISSAPNVEGPQPLLRRSTSTHTGIHNIVSRYLQAAKPQRYFFKNKAILTIRTKKPQQILSVVLLQERQLFLDTSAAGWVRYLGRGQQSWSTGNKRSIKVLRALPGVMVLSRADLGPGPAAGAASRSPASIPPRVR